MTTTEKLYWKKAIAGLLAGKWWTEVDEMVDEINEALDESGIEFEAYCWGDEYVTIENEEVVYTAYLGHANRTMWVERVVLA